MKHIKYYIMALLALPLMAACNDDDYNAPTPAGNPVMSYTAPTEAVWMGDEVEVKVNCKDEGGIALSTLKANLLFSGQSVDATTIRTKEEGEYTVKLKVPYAQYIPDGQVDIQLTLQNVSTKSNTETLPLNIKRPHFTDLQFITSDGEKYDMTETSDFLYQAILPTSKNSFKGYFATKDGKFTFGSSTGTTIDLGETGNFNFISSTTSDVAVTFDGKNYTAGPTDELPVTLLDFSDTDAGKTWVGDIKQGATCKLTIDAQALDADWYYDSDWFTKEADGTYTFKAISGRYTIQADFTHKSFRIWAMDGDNPMKLKADGTGAVWVIGSAGFNKPTWDAINHSWWTGTENDVCLTPIKDKVYQMTLTVGKQLNASQSNDFKFFGQPNWGTEFKGKDNDHTVSTNSEVFYITDSGNIKPKEGVTLKDGDTYVFTLDLSASATVGVLTVTKK